MRDASWFRVVVGGAIWAAAYNAVWAIAWFGFMRSEWATAAALSGRSMPWTPDFWIVWIPLTLPLGVAIAAYLNGARQGRTLRTAVAASLVLWVPGTIAMAVWFAFSPRTIVIDSGVNLLALLLASFVVGRRFAARSSTAGGNLAPTELPGAPSGLG